MCFKLNLNIKTIIFQSNFFLINTLGTSRDSDFRPLNLDSFGRKQCVVFLKPGKIVRKS